MEDDELNLDPTASIRAVHSEQVQARLALMEQVAAKYVRTPRDNLLWEEVDDLLQKMSMRPDPDRPHAHDNRPEGRALVVVGETGAGKTTALTRLFKRHPAFPGYGKVSSGCPLVTVRTPSPCNLAQLGSATLAELGYPVEREVKAPIAWAMVRQRLRALNVLVLHFDEMQHVVETANVNEIIKIRNTVKSLMQTTDAPVSLIISGLPVLTGFLEDSPTPGQDKDGQVRRRSHFVAFERLALPKDGKMVATMVEGLAKVARLSVPPDAVTTLAPRLVHAARYALGTAIELTHDAIRRALVRGDDAVGTDHFADAYARRTGNQAPANPFLAPDWTAVDTSRVLRADNHPDLSDDEEADSGRRRHGRPRNAGV